MDIINCLDQWTSQNQSFWSFITGFFAIVGGVATLFINTARRNKLDKKKYALEIMSNWNENTVKVTSKLREKYEDHYKTCRKIDLSELEKLKNENQTLGDQIIYLFNYFEFIATACKNHAVNKKMISDAFSVSMFRYTVLLQDYLMFENDKANRNHWKPYTEYIEFLIRKQKIKCNKECIDCPKKLNNEFYKKLQILNS